MVYVCIVYKQFINIIYINMTMTQDKNYIIDPLTSLCKIALLYFMPAGTKLGINRHVLHIQEYNYYQCFERMKNGNTRHDISNLNTPLLKAIKWYILENMDRIDMDDELLENIKIIAIFAIKGLQKLQNLTYNGDISIKIILQQFINLLRDALNGTWNEENIIKFDNDNSILSDKIKYNFESHIISSIAKMLKDAEIMNTPKEDISALIDCSHRLLINRDVVFLKLMREINTSL